MNITIIVPVYNVSSYIERCIRSVINQTFESLECIIVNDCTQDDSIQKCERLISEYCGPIEFTILNHERNRGLSAARNTGTEAAKGEYVYYLDSDDELPTGAIEILYKEVLIHPDVEMVQGVTKAVPEHDYYDISFLDGINYIEDNDWVRLHYYRLKKKLPTTAWNKLVRRSFIIGNDLYFKEGLIHEDELWTYLVVKKLSKYAIAHHITYIHYETPNSIMSNETKERTTLHWGIILNDVLNHLDSPYKKLQLLNYTQRLVWAYGLYKNDDVYLPLNRRFVHQLICNRLYKLAMILWCHFFFFAHLNNTYFYNRLNNLIEYSAKRYIYER